MRFASNFWLGNEAVTKLPRKQQRKVLEMVQALVEQYMRRAS
jgi:hypothetical protein